MCGIIAVLDKGVDVGQRLIDGLCRLEYRGYDSAGLALFFSGAAGGSAAGGDGVPSLGLAAGNVAGNNEGEVEFLPTGQAIFYRKVGKTSELRNLYCSHRSYYNCYDRYDGDGRKYFYEKALPVFPAVLGLGHTRWATHGKPSLPNTHPIAAGKTVVVHNGIIENYRELRAKLTTKLAGDTDTETMVALVDEVFARRLSVAAPKGDRESIAAAVGAISVAQYKCLENLSDNEHAFCQAVLEVRTEVEGVYSAVFASSVCPEMLIGVCEGLSLIAAVSQSAKEEAVAVYVVSDVVALPAGDYALYYLDQGETVIATVGGIVMLDAAGQWSAKAPSFYTRDRLAVDLDPGLGVDQDKGHLYREIHEQPDVLQRLLVRYAADGAAMAAAAGDSSGITAIVPKGVDLGSYRAICFVACGTSYNAAMCARYWFDCLAGASGVEVKVEIASEFAYSFSRSQPDTLYIFISQSGETADVLLALDRLQAVDSQAVTLALVNNLATKLARRTVGVIDIGAGIESAVASTKAYSAQLLCLLLLGVAAGWVDKSAYRRALWGDEDGEAALAGGVVVEGGGKRRGAAQSAMIDACRQVLTLEAAIGKAAKLIPAARLVVFAGRGVSYPLSMEAALKMKELTYIPCESVPGGEFKHGPLALIDDRVVTVLIAPDHDEKVFSKLVSNAQEIHCRDGKIIAFTGQRGAEFLADFVDECVILPTTGDYSCCFSYIIALQLLVYHVTKLMGNDVDRPRNLAKSLTVE